MHRLIVALLAAVDAALAAAVGLAATLAPLTLLWIFAFGGEADWGVLWPAAVSVWQLGNLVPLHITLPPGYLAATGIDSAAASFVLSLAPLAFAAFTAIFAARSGARASHADAWLTGVLGDFLNLDEYLGKRVSEDTVRSLWNAGSEASPYATWACPRGWLDDFSHDVTRIDVPTLILHGTADRILPIDGQGRRLHAALPSARYKEIDGGPHLGVVTHTEEVNRALLGFLDEQRGSR